LSRSTSSGGGALTSKWSSLVCTNYDGARHAGPGGALQVTAPACPVPYVPRWAIAFVAILALLGMFGLTGSSGAFASRVDSLLTGDEARSVREVFGTSRWIRSDEFAIEQAVDRAQQLAAPSYPVVNLNLGLGQLQRNPFSVPFLDWGLAFSPLSWPLLLGSPWAHGLRWFTRAAIIALGLMAWPGGCGSFFLGIRPDLARSTSSKHHRRGRTPPASW
jgi:hypothetical protein